jgi:hypothetical protein
MEPSELDALTRTLAASVSDVDATIGPTLAAPAKTPVHRALPRLAIGSAASGETDLEPTNILGQGGMGVVWLARQHSLDRSVAIKRLADARSAGAAAALVTEARASGALEHPAIVPVHALGPSSSVVTAIGSRRVSRS